MNNLCNVLVRTGTEVIAATAAIEPHELSLILSSTEKEDQSWLSLQEAQDTIFSKLEKKVSAVLDLRSLLEKLLVTSTLERSTVKSVNAWSRTSQ